MKNYKFVYKSRSHVFTLSNQDIIGQLNLIYAMKPTDKKETSALWPNLCWILFEKYTFITLICQS